MKVLKSVAYSVLNKKIGELIGNSVKDNKLQLLNGYYYFDNDYFDSAQSEFLDHVELIINEYGASIDAPDSLIECWLWHFPSMLGSFGYIPALTHHIYFNPVMMDLGMMQFISSVHISVISNKEWSDVDLKEHYEDCLSMLNEMVDHPYKSEFFSRNAEFYLSEKCNKNIFKVSEVIQIMILKGFKDQGDDQGVRHGFNWLFKSENYQLETFDKSNKFFDEVMEYICENEVLNHSMSGFMNGYCRGELTIGDLQCMIQVVILITIIDFLREREGNLSEFGIGTLAYIIKMITHACVIRSEGIGITAQIKLMLLDPITLNDQTYKQIVHYYASFLKYYSNNVVGEFNQQEALYMLERYDQMIANYIGFDNLAPKPKQSIKAKMKDIMIAHKNLDKDQKAMINRTFFQAF